MKRPLPRWCNLVVVLILTQLSMVLAMSGTEAPRNRSFVVDSTQRVFLKDGEPFQYISGSMHYFRIPREYWHDRLNKAKAAGLDAISIYVPWNLHEPEEGVYNFDGMADVEAFMDLAAKYDLLVILRVGPYICAEWDNGGLPVWLMRKNRNMKIRSSAPGRFLNLMCAVQNKLDVQYKQACQHGGVIFLFRTNLISTNSADYMNEVDRWMGIILPKMKRFLYTEGGPIIMVQLENEYGIYYTCDRKYLEQLYDIARKHLGPDIVLFTTDSQAKHFLECGSSDPRYLTTIDFAPTTDSPEKSFSLLKNFKPNEPWVNSELYLGWFDEWGRRHSTRDPRLSRDSLIRLVTYSPSVSVNIYMFHGGTNFGYSAGTLREVPSITSYDYDAPISEAGDLTWKYQLIREAIFATGHLLLGREGGQVAETPVNMEMFRQGLIGPVKANGQLLTPWTMLGFRDVNTSQSFSKTGTIWPIVGATYGGTLDIDLEVNRHDTYLHMDTFKRGLLIVNGINLGRFDTKRGPQHRLYVPRPFLRAGSNDVTVIELEGIDPVGNGTDDLYVTSHTDQLWS
ncbi:unnamed protein product [Echinostoma caproni]|uniref:Beta-galactosidase n=1 Tax=Echinostoma caproni TaxID=27848 RepID=A0A183A9C9_9TREM|nr:unnamed protein product [Echinostoma caproni]